MCRAQNKDGTSEEKVELKVEGGASAAIAPKATVHQTDMLVVEGQMVTMHCQAIGNRDTHTHTYSNTHQVVSFSNSASFPPRLPHSCHYLV